MTNIILKIKNGCVCDIESSSKDVHIEIRDYDIQGFNPDGVDKDGEFKVFLWEIGDGKEI